MSGKYKSRRFDVPRGFKLRPTTDFAKENLFNILANRLEMEDLEVLDLFSGTGSIAFEFLSRGCREVTCIEKEAAHCTFIRKVRDELKDNHLQIIKTDVFRYIETCPRSFDLIFADPPYALPELARLPDQIFARRLLADTGLLILEHSAEYDFSPSPHFLENRQYGSVNFSLMGNPSIYPLSPYKSSQ